MKRVVVWLDLPELGVRLHTTVPEHLADRAAHRLRERAAVLLANTPAPEPTHAEEAEADGVEGVVVPVDQG